LSDEYNSFGKADEDDGFSFESILAEVKGSAFINGDKKTPPDVLQEKADRILREAAQIAAPQTAVQQVTAPQSVVQQISPPPPQITMAAGDPISPVYTRHAYNEPEFSDTDDLPMLITQFEDDNQQLRNEPKSASFGAPMDDMESLSQEQENRLNFSPDFTIPLNEDKTVIQSREINEHGEKAVIFIDRSHGITPQELDQETRVHSGIDVELDFPQDDKKPSIKSKLGFGKRNRQDEADFDFTSDDHFENEYDYGPVEEKVYKEPHLKEAVRKFAASCNSISIRVLPATVITLFMIILTYVYEAGMIVPFGIGYSLDLAAGTLILCLLFVMMLCAEIIIRGVDFLIKGVPNAESLILFSCVFSLISAAFTMISGAAAMLPFCAVSAMSLTFAAHGEKINLRAMTDSLKTAVSTSEPYGVQAEYNAEIDKSILKKVYNRTDGFYNNLMQPDITELTYRYATPILLIAALLLTILIVIVRGGVENSIHILSALLAAAAPFSALLTFSVPFATVVKSNRMSGAAIAGWGGADDICYTDGVCITDDDLFPPGMLKLSGVKVYDGASPENTIRYTASLILSSGSGLTGLFAEILKQQGLSAMRVDNFECHESGIAGLVGGAQVSTGSAAFMNLLGVRVPDDTNMKNAVYTVVNNRLVAMFAVDYKPLPSVQSALISMLKWRLDLYFAMRDFNVTPAMVGQKFKVPFDSFVFIPAKDSYSISDAHSHKIGRMAAVLNREGLNPFAEAITGGRLLRSASFFATILSVISAALGILIMFYMCWTGAFISASPGNLVIFMLCMLVTVLIICGYVRLKK